MTYLLVKCASGVLHKICFESLFLTISFSFFGHVQFFWCFCAIIGPRILIIPNVFQIREISGLFGHITLYMFSRSEAEGSSLDFSGLYWISNFIHTEVSTHVESCFWFTLGQLVYQTLIFTRLLWLFRRISYAIWMCWLLLVLDKTRLGGFAN